MKNCQNSCKNESNQQLMDILMDMTDVFLGGETERNTAEEEEEEESSSSSSSSSASTSGFHEGHPLDQLGRMPPAGKQGNQGWGGPPSLTTHFPTSTLTGLPLSLLCTSNTSEGYGDSPKKIRKKKKRSNKLDKDEAEGDQAKLPPLKRFNQSSDDGKKEKAAREEVTPLFSRVFSSFGPTTWQDNFSCEWCHSKVSSAGDLAKHFCIKHSENTCLSQCTFCLQEEKHGFFPCSKCGKICKLAPGLAMHMKSCGETTEERRQMREEEERRVSILTSKLSVSVFVLLFFVVLVFLLF